MANFQPAFQKMIHNEGGYVLHEVEGDRGGQTYAGIAKNFHPTWEGWIYIDKKDFNSPQLLNAVSDFYNRQFWRPIRGNDIQQQAVAEALFDFSVNAGIRTASKLAQIVVDAAPDGIIGAKSIAKINDADPEKFLLKFALAKVARYAEICRKNPSQKKFLLGWVNRTLGGLA